MIKISPSILAADFARLGEEAQRAQQAGADMLHIDVMDGMFVPNITYGPCVMRALRPVTDLPFDVHLMIEEPGRYVQAFYEAGADIITVHAEATRHLHRVLGQIKALGIKAGVALNPATPAEAVRHVLPLADLILVMTVNPGFGGQAYISEMEEKAKAVKQMIAGRPIMLQADGGIGPKNVSAITKAGVDVVVAGSSLFGAHDMAAAITALRENACSENS